MTNSKKSQLSDLTAATDDHVAAADVDSDLPTSPVPVAPPKATDFSEFFSDPEYASQNSTTRPWAQAMRGENPAQCGLFIPETSAALLTWVDSYPIADHFVQYIMPDGKEIPGFLFKQPRLLVIPRTQVLARETIESSQGVKFNYLGNYRKVDYQNDPTVKNVQAFDIVFLDDNNKKIHDVAISLVLKGASQASFSITFKDFCENFGKIFAKSQNQPPKRMGAKFNSLLVFTPQIKRLSVGTTQTSFSFKVDGYDRLTDQNWMEYFIGGDLELKEFVASLTPSDQLLDAETVNRLPSISAAGMYQAGFINGQATYPIHGVKSQTALNPSHPREGEQLTTLKHLAEDSFASGKHQQQPGVTFPARPISLPDNQTTGIPEEDFEIPF